MYKTGYVIERAADGCWLGSKSCLAGSVVCVHSIDEAFVFGSRGRASKALMGCPSAWGCRVVEVVVERVVKKKISVVP